MTYEAIGHQVPKIQKICLRTFSYFDSAAEVLRTSKKLHTRLLKLTVFKEANASTRFLFSTYFLTCTYLCPSNWSSLVIYCFVNSTEQYKGDCLSDKRSWSKTKKIYDPGDDLQQKILRQNRFRCWFCTRGLVVDRSKKCFVRYHHQQLIF